MSENQKKTVIQVTDPMLLKIGVTRIPITTPSPSNIQTFPVDGAQARSRNPYSEKRVSNTK